MPNCTFKAWSTSCHGAVQLHMRCLVQAAERAPTSVHYILLHLSVKRLHDLIHVICYSNHCRACELCGAPAFLPVTHH